MDGRANCEGRAPSSTVKKTVESGLRAIAAMFLRFSNAKVRDLLLLWVRKSTTIESSTYLTRSNTDTRFPTGLRTEFPSGVNSTFPCL